MFPARQTFAAHLDVFGARCRWYGLYDLPDFESSTFSGLLRAAGIINPLGSARPARYRFNGSTATKDRAELPLQLVNATRQPSHLASVAGQMSRAAKHTGRAPATGLAAGNRRPHRLQHGLEVIAAQVFGLKRKLTLVQDLWCWTK